MSLLKVVLWGYYGPNYGDNIMLEVLLEYFNKKNIKVTLIQMYDFTLQYKIHRYNNVEIIPFNYYSRLEKLKALKTLAKADLNLWGGGTIFTDTDGDGNYRYFSLIKFFGGKIGYIGVGIGNLTDKKRIKKTKKLLSWSSLSVFRDKISLKRAQKLVPNQNYQLAEDLVYVWLNSRENINDQVSNKYILLTWRNLRGYLRFEKELELMKDTIDVIKYIMKKNSIQKVKLVALDTNLDVDSCRILYKLLKTKNVNVEFDIDSSISNITDLIVNSYIHFSGRLHGSLVSEYYGINTITLSYSPKIQYFYESINSKRYLDIYKNKINIESVDKILQKAPEKINRIEKFNESRLNFNFLESFFK